MLPSCKDTFVLKRAPITTNSPLVKGLPYVLHVLIHRSFQWNIHYHYTNVLCIGGGVKGAMPPKFLENIVILCFERRFSKQNSVIRLKSDILHPPNFWTGYATGSMIPIYVCFSVQCHKSSPHRTFTWVFHRYLLPLATQPHRFTTRSNISTCFNFLLRQHFAKKLNAPFFI